MNAVSALNWAKFFAALLADLSDYARELHRRHRGDVEAARAELVAVRNHGARLQAREDGIDSRLEAVAERERGQR